MMGGWATTLNQNTKLTPFLVAQAVKSIVPFFDDLNNYLADHEMEPVNFLGPVGSAFYFDDDLINQPNVEYGDIDVLVSLPRIENVTPNQNVQLFLRQIKAFAKTCNLPFIVSDLTDDEQSGQFIIINIDSSLIQLDLIFTFNDCSEWALARYTPQHNIKGAIFGNLLSSFAETLNLSIQGYGVQAKLIDGEMVSFRRKAELIQISKDPNQFMIDILRFFAGDDAKIDLILVAFPGFSKFETKILNLSYSITGLANSLEENNSFGTGRLFDIKSAEHLLLLVANKYIDKMEAATNSQKFDKAVTDISKAKADKVKKQFSDVSSQIVKVLLDGYIQ